MPRILPDPYRHLIRPALFTLPAEAAQRVAEMALGQTPLWRALSPALRVRNSRLESELYGLRLKNPIGLAAGFDKDCKLLPSLAALGFGYLVVGTVTESPRPGNPRPRMFRYVKDASLINALGFPGSGLEAAARRLERSRARTERTPVVVSVSGTTTEEIVRCHRRLEPLVDAVEINFSSPNTEGLRAFHEPAALKALLGKVGDGRTTPLMVKMPPYPIDGQGGDGGPGREQILSLARVCREEGVDALTVANSRPAADPRLSTGSGGLSGRLVYDAMLTMVADIRAEVGNGPAINACGGVFTGDDAWRALEAGATTVQLYTGFVYRGPTIVRKIGRELLAAMDRAGVARLSSLPSPERPSAGPG